jgi:hypothetical protein
MVSFPRDDAMFHAMIVKGYKNVSILDDPQLKACIFVVIQERTFELIFKIRIGC